MTRQTAKQKVAEQQAGVRYGCYIDVDVAQHENAYGYCVKDHGDENGCLYAKRHRTRESCKYWRAIEAKEALK